jgi:sec-independent protein translocase protein TatB
MPSGFSPMHIFVVMVVALIVLGPYRLMDSARQLGRALGQFRRWSEEMKDEVRGVVEPMRSELRSSMNDVSTNGRAAPGNGAAAPANPTGGATEASDPVAGEGTGSTT